MSWIKVFGAFLAAAALAFGAAVYLSSVTSEPTTPSAIRLELAEDQVGADEPAAKERAPDRERREKVEDTRKPRPGAGEGDSTQAQPAPPPPPCPAGDDSGVDDSDADCDDDEDDADDLDDEEDDGD